MKKSLIFILGFAAITSLIVSESCKKKEEAAPIADFSINSVSVSEGDTIILSSKSSNAKTFQWTFSGSSWTSAAANTSFIADSAGKFNLNLEVKNGDGKSSSKKIDVTILPDTAWRMSNNSKKTWYLKSINYNGTEQLSLSCQNDDEFVVYKTSMTSTDTCQLTEGANTCPSGSYLFSLPATSAWRLSKGKFEFALTVFGSPINLSFAITKCTKREFEGIDAANSVSIKLKSK